MKKMTILIFHKILKLFIVVFRWKKINKDVEIARNEISEKFIPNKLWNDSDFSSVNNVSKRIDVSIIVPVYNTEKYLEDCIDSLVNQKTSYKYELIFVNDGSTDNSSEILSKYSSKNENIVVINQKNGGLSAARNTGINNANGTYIGFIDSDDYVDEGYIDKLLSRAYNDNSDMVKTGYYEINSETKAMLRTIAFENENINMEIDNEKILKIKGHGCGSLIKRAIFDNIRFPVGYWYEDMIMRFMVMQKCKTISVLDDVLYYYRINVNGLSRKTQKVCSYKCLEQYFLLENIMKANSSIGIKNNRAIYEAMLHELGPVLWLRTRRIDKNARRNVFVLACDLHKKNKINGCELNFNQKYIKRSLENEDYLSWKMISIYCMIEIKYF